MNAEYPLPCSPDSLTGLCPEPVETSPYLIPLRYILILPFHVRLGVQVCHTQNALKISIHSGEEIRNHHINGLTHQYRKQMLFTEL